MPVPPDGGWGWVIVFAAFVTNLIIDGICVSFGIMVTDLVEHFNASVAVVMLMGSLLLGVYQIVGELLNPLPADSVLFIANGSRSDEIFIFPLWLITLSVLVVLMD